jgi:superfamily I DNA/RNA helicase
MPRVHPDKWIPKGVESLEPAAENVVRSRNNTIVIAGPGAGKTELLAQRACYLLETGECPAPKRILAISFKRDAAKNLDDRVEKRCGSLASRFDSLTLDGFGKGLVDRFRAGLPEEWRPAAAYEPMVKSPTNREMRDWFESIPVPPELQRIDFKTVADDELKRRFELCAYGVTLPYDISTTKPLVRHYGLRWWREQLDTASGQPSLLFPMLNRLAAYILRENPKLLAALRSTFSHVFLDEFQDTTGSQYELVQAAFLGSSSVLTAVGDSKQRIMVWAGAMQDVFDVFKTDFSAQCHPLSRNYRSAPELVRIQRTIAEAIESGTPPAVAVRKNPSKGECYIAEFGTPEQEAKFLAELISSELAQGGVKPRDFCVLARQQAGGMTAILQNALREKGVRLRDESELQDLVSEPAIQVVLAILRLVTRPRDPEAWEFLCGELAYISGLDPGEDGRRLDAEVQAILQFVRTEVARPNCSINELPSLIVKKIGTAKFRSCYRQYSNAKFLSERLSLCGKTLNGGALGGLGAAVNDMIGLDIVPAMTVHKSKGLEFQTVIFLGLEDSQLWNFAKQSDEERRGFFVAFSRAITRVIFTFSDVRDGKYGRKRQGRTVINDLYSLLQAAGVESRNLR